MNTVFIHRKAMETEAHRGQASAGEPWGQRGTREHQHRRGVMCGAQEHGAVKRGRGREAAMAHCFLPSTPVLSAPHLHSAPSHCGLCTHRHIPEVSTVALMEDPDWGWRSLPEIGKGLDCSIRGVCHKYLPGSANH